MEQQAPPSTAFYDFLGWLDVNKKRIAVGAAIVAIVALAVALVIWQKGQREIEAAQELSAIRVPFNPTEPTAAGTAEALVKVAEKYPKTVAGGQALLRAAGAFFAEGQFAKAQEQFEKFLRGYGDTQWVPEAQFGIATCLDAQGKATDAITKYNDFIRTYPNDPAADPAKLNLARLYETTKQPAQAVDVLSKMTNAPAFSSAAAEVQERLKDLYTKHPELAPAPPVRPTPQMIPQITPQMLTNATRTNILRPTNAPAGTTPTATPPKIILQTPDPNKGK